MTGENTTDPEVADTFLIVERLGGIVLCQSCMFAILYHAVNHIPEDSFQDWLDDLAEAMK